MPVVDLSQVTSSLMRMLAEYVDVRLEPGLVINPTPLSPEHLAGGSLLNTISVYLHHVEEAASSRVHGASGGSNVPVKHRAMALALRYVITAHHIDVDAKPDPLIEQKLLGYAAKTIHDHPWLSDSTHIDASADPIFVQTGMAGANNALSLVLLKLRPEEAPSVLGNNAAPRPALYLEAALLELEPEAPTTASNIVTAVGGYLQVGSGPYLDHSHSMLTFAPPAASGSSQPISIKRQPAQVTIATILPAPASAPPLPSGPQNNRLFLAGGGLGSGGRTLELAGARGTFQLFIDEPAASLPRVDSFWHAQASPSGVAVSVHQQMFDRISNSEVDVFPGMYLVRVLREQPAPDGGTPIVAATNAVAVAIAPAIVAVTLLGPRHFRFDIAGDYLARPAPPPPNAPPAQDFTIQLSVGGEVIADLHDVTSQPYPPAPPPTQNAYDRHSDHFEVWLRSGGPIDTLSNTHPLPIRLIIDGAEAPPKWLEQP